MATRGNRIQRTNFDTTPYHYQETSGFSQGTWYWFYKSNVSWDVYIKCGSVSPVNMCYIRLDFYDYDAGTWVPYTSDAGTCDGYGYQTVLLISQVFRFFHNCLVNYDNSAYTADVKWKDDTALYNNGHTYDTRGYSLWRIGFYFIRNTSNNDFNINSYGPSADHL